MPRRPVTGQPVIGPPARGHAGCFGKLPARGDFLLRGLPRAFADPWHDWLLDGMQASRAALGEGWLGRYLNAPVWRFTLGAGVCGPLAAAGVLMPSVDKAGRHFPLTLVTLFTPGGADTDQGWFDAAEGLALSALSHTLDVEAFVAAIAALPAPPAGASAPAGARWWTTNGPGGGEGGDGRSFATAGLPDAAAFTAFLADPACDGPASDWPAFDAEEA
ncbi:type VI secretion system-associated protein TagF [Azospirillum sp. TSO35-2]|uniref:type VI secretion system-associated protein TagF n=1 Tax=Azospirillum sp. TSO35-2 TaxID=716796 RepID=UPI000D60B068|nr:type VI secretion system-associated protein TagF [Azospirillum sp. TSO35-2]PWC34040.1 hypothetical protein TSO352_27315 [Azospirillum sp. TSO35-2]